MNEDNQILEPHQSFENVQQDGTTTINCYLTDNIYEAVGDNPHAYVEYVNDANADDLYCFTTFEENEAPTDFDPHGEEVFNTTLTEDKKCPPFLLILLFLLIIKN